MSMLTAAVQRWRAWARRHSYSFFSSLGALLRHRLGTLMTVLVLGIALLLPLGLYVTLANLDRVELNEKEWGALTVFIRQGTDAGEVQSFGDRLTARADVAAVALVSPEQGMAEFREASGFGAALELLESNPLPWVVSVTPVAGGGSDLQARVDALIGALEAEALVDSVQYDHKWLQRLGRLLDLGNAAVAVLTALFALAVVVLVSNTIRLDVAARAEEIEVLALVGANNGFIRLPFLYSGFWYGLLGGIAAMVLLNGALLYLDRPLGRLMDSYGHQLELLGPSAVQTLGLLFGGGLLGLLGAWIAVQRYLRILRVGGSLGRR